MSVIIRQVTFGSELYKQILDLRYEVLRKPIGLEVSEKDVALDHMEYLFAAFDGEKMIGCVQLRPLSGSLIKLRQMAVADAYQGRGIGARLVREAQRAAAEKGFASIETNARKTAQGFYEKLGYEPVGGEFMEVNLHTIKMHKKL